MNTSIELHHLYPLSFTLSYYLLLHLCLGPCGEPGDVFYEQVYPSKGPCGPPGYFGPPGIIGSSGAQGPKGCQGTATYQNQHYIFAFALQKSCDVLFWTFLWFFGFHLRAKGRCWILGIAWPTWSTRKRWTSWTNRTTWCEGATRKTGYVCLHYY